MADSSDPASPAPRHRAVSQIEEGIALARAGDRVGARDIFRRIIHNAPENEDAWLWLAWVAESPQQSVKYLQEAQKLLPNSQRIAEAIQWANRQLTSEMAQQAPEAQDVSTASQTQRPAKPSVVTRVAKSASQAAQTARQSAEEKLEHLKDKTYSLNLPKPGAEQMSRATIPVLSILVVLALAIVVIWGISNARGKGRTVQALALPTPVLNATPTPTIKERTQPLWTQVEVAWTRQDWDAAIDALERIRALDPHDENARKRMGGAYYGRGLKLIQANKLEEAQIALDWAVRYNADSEELQKLRRELKLYLLGVEAYWMRDWQRATENLKKVYQSNPNFRDAHVMLGQAYYELGMERQKAEVWEEARDAYKACLEFLPDLTDAKKRLAQVMDILIPPKRIEVDLSDQLVRVYENHKAIHTFKVCTGRSTAPTVPGRYQILDKLPMAYASKWDLHMPWWLGIYWAGGSENGFHALPILSNGRVLWAGYLGRPCSYGCIVLDTNDAKTLYDWAEVGITVMVNP